jgi:hypothetical protein
MKLYRVNTTAYEEEDLFLLTDLSEQEITEVVHPIVMAERDGEEEYDNESILIALKKRYPNQTIIIVDEPEYLQY